MQVSRGSACVATGDRRQAALSKAERTLGPPLPRGQERLLSLEDWSASQTLSSPSPHPLLSLSSPPQTEPPAAAAVLACWHAGTLAHATLAHATLAHAPAVRRHLAA